MVMKMVNMAKMVAKGKMAATMVQQVKTMKMQAGGLEFQIFSSGFGDVLFDMMIFTIFIVTWNDFDFKSIWL